LIRLSRFRENSSEIPDTETTAPAAAVPGGRNCLTMPELSHTTLRRVKNKKQTNLI